MDFKKSGFALITILLLCSITFSQMNNALILHYSFDSGNAQDEIGNQHGTVNGPVLCEDRFGNPNMAYEFSNNTISHDNLIFGTTLAEVSFSMWLKPDAATFTGGVATPMSCGVWALYMNSLGAQGSAIAILDGTINNNSSGNATSLLPTNDWFHIVATNDGSITRVYVNGQLENQYSESLLWIDASYNLYLGVRGYGNNAPADYYNGKLDDFRVYEKALSIEEVDTLYNMPNPTASIAENTMVSEVLIYPNPSGGIYTLEFNDSSISANWEVFDMTGRKITTGKGNGSTTIDISDHPDGSYIVHYKVDNGLQGSILLLKNQEQ